MPKIDIPNEEEKRIMQENSIDPKAFCVTMRSDDMIVLRNYKTRDDITIYKGDRKW